MADRTIKPDDTNDLVLQNNDGSAKLELNEDQTVKVTTGSDAGEDFTVNTSQLVVEGDTGRVGVGTATPSHQIHVSGATPIIQMTDTDTGADSLITASNGTGSLKIQCDNNSETANSTFEVDIDGSQRMKVDSSGHMTITDGDLVIGTAGHGITFQDATNDNTVSNQSYTLNQYETGDWTPVLTNGTSNAGLDPASSAIYTRIGNCVFISGRVEGDGSTTIPSGNLRIDGLPFNCGTGSTKYYNSISVSQSSGLNISASENIVMRTSLGESYLILVLWDSSGGTTNLQGSEFTNDGDIMFSGVYFVD